MAHLNVAKRVALAAFHVGAATIMMRGFRSLQTLGDFDKWMDDQVGGYAQFLTINGLWVACFVMIGGFFKDLIPRSRFPQIFQGVSDIKRLLLLIALPISIVVAGVYWPLILFAPHLMLAQLPTSTESTIDAPPALFSIPLHIDIPMHGLPGPFLLLDFFLCERKFSQQIVTRSGPLLAVVIGTTYIFWMEYCASYNGYFPYPFLTGQSPLVRLIIYITATVGSVLVFRGVNWLHP